jgi:hypothetical protein
MLFVYLSLYVLCVFGRVGGWIHGWMDLVYVCTPH